MNAMNAIGYIRVSTEEQSREGVSLDNQEAKIRAYSDLNSFTLTEIIRDEGKSAKTLDREGMTRLLWAIEQGKADTVIVYKLDRLSRNTLDTLNLIQQFETKGIAFHSISEKIDTKSATGKFFLTIISALAQMERDLISERTIDALAHKRNNQEWCGRIPYGFKKEGCRLTENPDEMKIILRAKRMRREGKSMRYISSTCNISVGTTHKILTANLKSVKHQYLNNLC